MSSQKKRKTGESQPEMLGIPEEQNHDINMIIWDIKNNGPDYEYPELFLTSSNYLFAILDFVEISDVQFETYLQKYRSKHQERIIKQNENLTNLLERLEVSRISPHVGHFALSIYDQFERAFLDAQSIFKVPLYTIHYKWWTYMLEMLNKFVKKTEHLNDTTPTLLLCDLLLKIKYGTKLNGGGYIQLDNCVEQVPNICIAHVEQNGSTNKPFIYWNSTALLELAHFYKSYIRNHKLPDCGKSTYALKLTSKINSLYVTYYTPKTTCEEKMKIYPHQKVISDILNVDDSTTRGTIVMVRTGAGKTRLITEKIIQCLDKGTKVLCIVKDRKLRQSLYKEFTDYENDSEIYHFLTGIPDGASNSRLQQIYDLYEQSNGQNNDEFNQHFRDRLMVTTFESLENRTRRIRTTRKPCNNLAAIMYKQQNNGLVVDSENTLVIIDEVHLLEKIQDSGFAYQNIIDFLGEHTFKHILGFSGTPGYTIENGEVKWNSLYETIMKPYNYLYYDTPDGFSTVDIFDLDPDKIVTRKDSLFDDIIIQPGKQFPDNIQEGLYYTIRPHRESPDDFLAQSRVKQFEEQGVTYVQKDNDITKYSTNTFGEIASNELLIKYFSPICSKLLTFIKSRPAYKRYLILATVSTGIEDIFRVMCKSFTDQVLIVSRNEKTNVRTQLKMFSDNVDQYRFLIYDAEQFTEGYSIKHVDAVINLCGYGGDYNSYLQAIGRVNRVCFPSPRMKDDDEVRKFKKNSTISIYNIVIQDSPTHHYMRNVIAGVKEHIKNKLILNNGSLCSFDGVSVKIFGDNLVTTEEDEVVYPEVLKYNNIDNISSEFLLNVVTVFDRSRDTALHWRSEFNALEGILGIVVFIGTDTQNYRRALKEQYKNKTYKEIRLCYGIHLYCLTEYFSINQIGNPQSNTSIVKLANSSSSTTACTLGCRGSSANADINIVKEDKNMEDKNVENNNTDNNYTRIEHVFASTSSGPDTDPVIYWNYNKLTTRVLSGPVVREGAMYTARTIFEINTYDSVL